MQGLGAGCPIQLLCNPRGAFPIEQSLWGAIAILGYNPRILAQQPCQGEEGSLSLGGNASFRAHSSEGQPHPWPGHNPLSSGSPGWHLASSGARPACVHVFLGEDLWL